MYWCARIYLIHKVGLNRAEIFMIYDVMEGPKTVEKRKHPCSRMIASMEQHNALDLYILYFMWYACLLLLHADIDASSFSIKN